MYEIYCKLREAKGLKDADVAKATGITKSTFSDWKNGRSKPKDEKLQKIADLFGVTTEYLRTGELKDDGKSYYLNDDARDLAQFMFENPEYKVLFDASRKVKKEDIEFVKQMIDRMRGDVDDTGC